MVYKTHSTEVKLLALRALEEGVDAPGGEPLRGQPPQHPSLGQAAHNHLHARMTVLHPRWPPVSHSAGSFARFASFRRIPIRNVTVCAVPRDPIIHQKIHRSRRIREAVFKLVYFVVWERSGRCGLSMHTSSGLGEHVLGGFGVGMAAVTRACSSLRLLPFTAFVAQCIERCIGRGSRCM